MGHARGMDVEAFRRILEDVDTRLPEKIRKARTALVLCDHTRNSRVNAEDTKEEVFLRWLCDKLHIETAWYAVEDCLNRVQVINLRLSPNIFIALMGQCCNAMAPGMEIPYISELGFKCAVHLIESPIFNRQFQIYPLEYISLIGSMLNFLAGNEANLSSYCYKITESLKHFARQTSQDGNYREKVLPSLLLELAHIFESFMLLPTYSELVEDMTKCFSGMLFPKIPVKIVCNSIERLLNSLLKGEEKITDIDVDVLVYLSELLSDLTPGECYSLITVIFRVFVVITGGEKENFDKARPLHIALILSYLLGFKPKILGNSPEFAVARSFFTLKSVHFSNKNVPIYGLKAIVQVLYDGNVNISAEIRGYTFVQWLQKLCLCVIAREEWAEDHTISLMTIVSELEPVILESQGFKVTKHIIFNRPAGSGMNSPEYSVFLKSLLNSAMKLHRIQKFTSKILSCAKEQFSQDPHLERNLTSSELFPLEFCEMFGRCTETLVATQALAMVRTFIYHLLEDCVKPMEQDSVSECLMLQLTKSLLCRFLECYKAVDMAIPGNKKAKFFRLMSEMAELMGRLGRALLRTVHNHNTMGAFLELCHSWGSLQMALLLYKNEDQDCESVPPLMPSLSTQQFTGQNNSELTTDFCSHQIHLSEGEWGHLVERIVNFGDDGCKDLLDGLIIQKLKTWQLFKNDMKPEQVQFCIHTLITRVRSSSNCLDRVVEDIDVVAPMLNLQEAMQILEIVVVHAAYIDEQPLVALYDCAIPLSITTMAILKAIKEKAFLQDDQCGQRQDIANIMFAQVVDTMSSILKDYGHKKVDDELSLESNGPISKLCASLTEVLASYLDSYFTAVDDVSQKPSVFVLEDLVAMMKAVNELPLLYLSPLYRVVVMYSLVGLLISLKQHHYGSEGDESELLISKAMILVLKGSPVFGELVLHMNVGKFLRWFIDTLTKSQNISRDEDLNVLQEEILERLVQVCLSKPSGLKQLSSCVKHTNAKLKRGGADETLMCKVYSMLLPAFQKKAARAVKPRTKEICQKCCRTMSAAIIKSVSFEPAKVNKQKLECFSLVLQIFINNRAEKRIAEAARYLQNLVKMAMEKVKSRILDHSETVIASIRINYASEPHELLSCCLKFLKMVLSVRMKLKKRLSSSFALDLWALLISAPCSRWTDKETMLSILNSLFVFSNKKEFKRFTDDMVDKLNTVDPDSPDPYMFSHYIIYWKCLARCSLNRGLAEYRNVVIKKTTPRFLSIVLRSRTISENLLQFVVTMVVPIVEFELILLNSGKMYPDNEIWDLVFESVSAIPLDESEFFLSPEYKAHSVKISQGLLTFQHAFLACANILLCIVSRHSTFLMDRIPLFAQCLSRLVNAVAVHGDIDFTADCVLMGSHLPDSLSMMSVCADTLVWITNELQKYKKDFSRVAPYILANALGTFEKNVIHPSVKNQLYRCMYALINLCDNNGLLFLNHSLSAASKEMFRVINQDYRKFFRFQGRI